MKKLFIFAMAFGLAACATDDADVKGGLTGGDAEVNYLNISVMSATGTRADYDNENGYEDGLTEESAVNSARFYFFYENGDAAPVDAGGSKSYADFPSSDQTLNPGAGISPNVTKIIDAVVVIKRKVNSSTGEISDLPQEVIAVLNYGTTLQQLHTEKGEMIKRSDLVDYINSFDGATEGNFVMSSSVYKENTTGAVSLAGKLYADADLAKNNPVKVYVERLVSKVDLSIDQAIKGVGDNVTVETNRTLYDTGVTVDGEKVYVEFLGWGVTGNANKSYLVKRVNEEWPNDALEATNLFRTAGEPWSYADFFRSFWAINPSDVTLTYTQSYNDFVTNTFDESNIAYLPENAGKAAGSTADNWTGAANEKASNVVVAAKLVKSDGTEFEIAEYGGTQTTVAAIKNKMLALFTDKPWRAKVGDEGDGYTQITANDVEYKTTLSVDGESGKGYFVYLRLTEAAQGYTWYSTDPSQEPMPEPMADAANAINEDLKELGHAKVWAEGQTYYFLDIQHLANPTFTEEGEALVAAKLATPGYYGNVRNHVYKTNIKSIKGLGTPVYDPDESIIPEIPEDAEVYIAADIRILSWRIVSHDYDLGW